MNRTQILTAGSISRPVKPWVTGQYSVNEALAQWNHGSHQFIVDPVGKTIGRVDKRTLEIAAQQGTDDLSQVMTTNVPPVRSSTPLDQTLHLYEQGGAIAVVDDTDHFIGVIDASDVLNAISTAKDAINSTDFSLETSHHDPATAKH